MTRIIRVTLSGIINGLIAGGGAYMALLTNLPEGAGLNMISMASLYVAFGTGVLTMLKDFQTALANSRQGPIKQG